MNKLHRLSLIAVMVLVVSCAFAQVIDTPPPPADLGGGPVVNATTPPQPAAPAVVVDSAPTLQQLAEEGARRLSEANNKLDVAKNQMDALRKENGRLANRPATTKTVVRQSQTVHNVTVRPTTIVRKDCGPLWKAMSWLQLQINNIVESIRGLKAKVQTHDEAIKQLRTDVDAMKGTAPAPAPDAPPPPPTPAPTPAPQTTPPPAAEALPNTSAAPAPAPAPAPQQNPPAAMVDTQARADAAAALAAAQAAQAAADAAAATASDAKTASDTAVTTATAATKAATSANEAVATMAAAVTQVSNEQKCDRSWIRSMMPWIWIAVILAALAMAINLFGFRRIQGGANTPNP